MTPNGRNGQALQLTGSATLNGTGTATVTVNGPPSLTRRLLGSIVVQCTTDTPRPTCTVYRSQIAPFRRMAYTRLGDGDTFISEGETLESGEPLFIVWAGGAPGAVVTVTVNCTDTITGA